MEFQKLKDQISKLRVLIIGDLILDRYYFTEVNRISPEAPVQVANFKSEERRLGGAANVALNFSALGAKTILVGLVGNDENAKILEKMVKEKDISLEKVSISDFHTISKTRIISKKQQMLRIDFERENYLQKTETSNKLLKILRKNIGKIDLIIISDYKKGTLNHQIINFLKNSKKYVAIDTKSIAFRDFEGFSLVKPNFSESKELMKILGDATDYKNTNEDLEKIGKTLQKKFKSHFLITRGETGASYIGEKIYHSNIPSSSIYDSTGAGDTCLAIFSLLNFLKYPPEESLRLMNFAAKITVSNLGTYSPTLDEIEQDVRQINPKILTKNNLISKIKSLKERNKKIVFTNGCFDILHKGHISYLKKARNLGDILIVGLNSDDSVRRAKGDGRPIIGEESRAFLLSHLECVDYVVIFERDLPDKLLEIIRPDYHVKGGDYTEDDLPEAKVARKVGAKIKILPLEEGFSTTSIIEKIRKTSEKSKG